MTALLLEEACEVGSMYINELRSMKEVPTHKDCAEAYFLMAHKGDIESRLRGTSPPCIKSKSEKTADTITKVIKVISQLIKETIASEIREAKMFSVQIDTTQDITAKDQCSVILRYVTDVVHENLVALVDSLQQDKTMKPTARAKVKGYIEGLLKYETVLTAQIFLRIFEHTSPLSKYLQTSGMDLLTAHRLVVE
ncbi:hypothetical protein QQF64_031436 [Cirrhinus molitorella]|uniref:DUF4371 domain-containing protein n=1 Tax=Cirrhinus molitorella TaxID=172907 RepID=A0ABR3MWZ0_9TELE